MNIIEEEMDRILGCDECEILEFNFEPLFSAVEAMQAEHAKQLEGFGMAKTLLGVAKCPTCDGSGAFYDNYGEVEQCQWCDEVKSLIHKDK